MFDTNVPSHPNQPTQPNHPDRADLRQYVLVFSDDRAPPEYEFTAISDEHATDLMRKQYPAFEWTLYRPAGGERDRVCAYPAEGAGAEAKPWAPPASGAGGAPATGG